MLLKLTGHDVHIAQDGLEAVEETATVEPDVILLDIGLPRLNGYEAARRIREQYPHKKRVFVEVSG
jgi:CheY-like chemotaxis protein